jgi:hypothetical protein
VFTCESPSGLSICDIFAIFHAKTPQRDHTQFRCHSLAKRTKILKIMNKKTKIRILWHLSFLIIFLIVWTILHFASRNLESPYKGMISGAIAGLLSPRITEYETQSGKQTQLKWIFMKKVIKI